MARKFGFSKKPYLEKQRRKQEELRLIEENRRIFQKERIYNKSWARRKSFKKNNYIRKWAAQKDSKESILTDLALNALSVCDAAAEVNEALLRGLELKETAIDMDATEDLTYNIYMVKLAEILCSNKGANLSRSVADKVISAIIAQIFPPSVAQKPTDPRRGERLIEDLTAIRSSLR